MDINRKQAVELDIILKGSNGLITSIDSIKKSISVEDTDYCINLFFQLKNHTPSLLREGSVQSYFLLTEYTRAFLSQGGFTEIYDKALLEEKKNSEIEELNLTKLRYDAKNAKRVYRTYWWTFAFAIIALGVSLYNFIKDLL